jgi:hypothetical protein
LNPVLCVFHRYRAAIHPTPSFLRQVEVTLLSTMSVPLNLSGNTANSFAAYLSRTRAAARREAAALAVVTDNGGPRRAA